MRVPVACPPSRWSWPARSGRAIPHPSRIAVAWNEGYVETWSAAELGVAEEQLALDAEMGSLVLGAERQRGQVLSGSPADAAAELVGILTAAT